MDTETKIITAGGRAVVINRQGNSVWANLYVGARKGMEDAIISPTCWKGKTMAGATRWAAKQLAGCI